MQYLSCDDGQLHWKWLLKVTDFASDLLPSAYSVDHTIECKDISYRAAYLSLASLEISNQAMPSHAALLAVTATHAASRGDRQNRAHAYEWDMLGDKASDCLATGIEGC